MGNLSIWRPRGILFAESAERAEQVLGSIYRHRVGLVQPIEFGGAPDAERMQEEDHFREIGPLNLRSVSLRPVQMTAFGPEPVANPGGGSTGAPFSLIRRGVANFLDLKRVDAALGVIP